MHEYVWDVWDMYGICAEYVWNMYGICMEHWRGPWNGHVTPAGLRFRSQTGPEASRAQTWTKRPHGDLTASYILIGRGYYKAAGGCCSAVIHTYSIHMSFIFHTYSIPIPYVFHTYVIHIPYLFHTYSIRIPYLFHTHSIPNGARPLTKPGKPLTKRETSVIHTE